MGLFQKDIAEQIGVSEDTITYWEKGRSQPQVKYYPKIFALLGYYPFTHENESITSKLQQLVHCKGWNHSQCAKALGIDSGTVKRILKGQRTFKQKSKNIETLWSALPKNLKQQYRLK